MPVPSIGATGSGLAVASPAGAIAPGTPCTPSFGALLEARGSRGAPAPPLAPTPQPPPATRLGGAALGALRGIEAAQARLDGLLASARSGRTFTAQELLALQGEAHAYSRTVELSAKLAELGAQSVKQALQAQV
jgi:hypothetical protein